MALSKVFKKVNRTPADVVEQALQVTVADVHEAMGSAGRASEEATYTVGYRQPLYAIEPLLAPKLFSKIAQVEVAPGLLAETICMHYGCEVRI